MLILSIDYLNLDMNLLKNDICPHSADIFLFKHLILHDVWESYNDYILVMVNNTLIDNINIYRLCHTILGEQLFQTTIYFDNICNPRYMYEIE